MKPWHRLLDFLRKGPFPARRWFDLDEPLQAALEQRADLEQRPVEQIQTELLTAGLAHLRSADELKQCWEKLSPREQQMTALTCLGYTNRQIAARLCLSPETIKGYVHQALVKFHAHGKEELRLLLAEWDFSGWAQI
jgi:DNA-binding CsgD family transcriptional regulator